MAAPLTQAEQDALGAELADYREQAEKQALDLAAAQEKVKALEAEVTDLKHPPIDRPDSGANIRLTDSDRFEFEAYGDFFKRLPHALVKLAWSAAKQIWELVPPELKLKAGIGIWATVSLVLLSLAHSIATIASHLIVWAHGR